ncbi:neuronal acetylcholine receptor subunit alpha-2-like [Argopecten irradians]|uniref:neuronal acetylcholine receptor subunit alpha-2-like n=1 Tax=Argopecten irradians TaxID=31199 RepID=UPI0037146CAD
MEFLVLFFLQLFLTLGASENMDSAIQKMLKAYNKVLHPATRDNQTVVVRHGLSLIRIVDLKDDVMTVDIWQDMEWSDPRLRWMPDVFDKINIDIDLLWMPDIVLYNSGGVVSDLYPVVPRQALVSYDGTVFVVHILRLKVWCGDQSGCSNVDQDGTNTCKMKFGSWGYDGFRLDLQKRMDNMDLSSLSEHREWKVKNTTAVRNVVRYSCCVEPYPDITYTVQLAPKLDGGPSC